MNLQIAYTLLRTVLAFVALVSVPTHLLMKILLSYQVSQDIMTFWFMLLFAGLWAFIHFNFILQPRLQEFNDDPIEYIQEPKHYHFQKAVAA